MQVNPDHPAVYVSWEDVQAFLQKLNQAARSELYRLPTEAEWEYACRAGTTTLWSFGDDETILGDYAWYVDNAWNVDEQYAHRVGTKLPNPWRLHDLHGNVWEWVWDWYGPYSSSLQVDPTGPSSVTSAAIVAAASASLPDTCGQRIAAAPSRSKATVPSASGWRGRPNEICPQSSEVERAYSQILSRRA